MLSINTNLSSLIAQNSMKSSSFKLDTAIERMTTGYKINHAKDNAANYSISTNMTTRIGAYMVAEDNCLQGLNLLSTASESLNLIEDKLQRLQALSIQARNGTYGAQSLNAINSEADALLTEVEREYRTNLKSINPAKVKKPEAEPVDTKHRDTSGMTPLKDVDENVALNSGTYSISSAEELAKLATMTNNDLIGYNTEFVLANDIDLKEWCDAHASTGGWVPIGGSQNNFWADFDGNGYTISNLTINKPNYTNYVTGDGKNLALFGYCTGANIKNLNLENVNVTGYSNVASLVADGRAYITNCQATGVVKAEYYVGGLAGGLTGGSITDSYADVDVTTTYSGAGGLIYSTNNNFKITRCFALGDVKSQAPDGYAIGGLVGSAYSANINDSFSLAKVTPGSVLTTGAFVGVAPSNCISSNNYCTTDYRDVLVGQDQTATGFDVTGKSEAEIRDENFLKSLGFTEENGWYIENGLPMLKLFEPEKEDDMLEFLNFQVGVGGTETSSISIDVTFNLDSIADLRSISITDGEYAEKIDLIFKSINSINLNLGASTNRLESALDEISIQYENLVSSRSTIRDADMAEVSSEYIRQQILQQASATLMSTANQSPAIALQLI